MDEIKSNQRTLFKISEINNDIEKLLIKDTKKKKKYSIEEIKTRLS